MILRVGLLCGLDLVYWCSASSLFWCLREVPGFCFLVCDFCVWCLMLVWVCGLRLVLVDLRLCGL